MTSQSPDLHRALLRPLILHTLRAAGFHSTKPSVMDTMLTLTERYILLLASTTAKYAHATHNDSIPTITDVRMAMQDCGVLAPGEGAGEEGWTEVLRKPVEVLGEEVESGGSGRREAVKRKREGEDVGDVGRFVGWFEGRGYAEIKRVAGMSGEDVAGRPGVGAVGAVGVGGGKVAVEDFLTGLKRRQARAGDLDGEGRLVGTVLGKGVEGEEEESGGLVIEGGPVHGLEEWAAKMRELAATRGADNEMREMDHGETAAAAG